MGRDRRQDGGEALIARSTQRFADPTRTCVGCRGHEPRAGLVRVVLGPDGSAVVDHPPRLGGRGAWVHASERCVREAVRKGGLARALQGQVSSRADDLVDAVRVRLTRRVESLLASARRAGRAEAGATAVAEAIREGRAALVVAAEDAAAGAKGVGAVRFGTKELLGGIWGRDVLGVIAVTDAGLAGAIAAEVERLRTLAEGGRVEAGASSVREARGTPAPRTERPNEGTGR